jgi:hypothetical protein
VDVGGLGGQRVGQLLFTADSATTGVTVQAQNVIASWGDPLNFGSSTSDNALESIMQSIRWSANPAPVSVSMDSLFPGATYRLQLLFHEVRHMICAFESFLLLSCTPTPAVSTSCAHGRVRVALACPYILAADTHAFARLGMLLARVRHPGRRHHDCASVLPSGRTGRHDRS